MDKTEESTLLELQELALKHKSSKRQKTLEEKQMIVKAHLLNHVPVSQLSKNFGIHSVTIWRWINTFADVHRASSLSGVLSREPSMRCWQTPVHSIHVYWGHLSESDVCIGSNSIGNAVCSYLGMFYKIACKTLADDS